ncbi:uncharacterized protein DUF4403 [Mesonia algae]|uniref:Uncharacterized protein DUF4403 n=1 Tax=Mesonia algae TaxID=213248 RepID=A0A2W7I420_9FLAO|nr:DUF4403 family protein [Mesonia algae]PZW41556.1 uncharacterized protein DUF4403 [Mesonia algae]
MNSYTEKENYQDEGIYIQMPVKIKLEALEKVFQQKMVGYKIQKEEDDSKQIGEILSVFLSPGTDGYDLNIQQEILMKTLLFSNKKVKFNFQLKLNYNAHEQELVVSDYKAEGEHKTWFTNQLLNVMLNSIFRKKILGKSKILLLPKIDELLLKMNEKLKNIVEVKSGVLLFGKVDQLRVLNLYFKENYLVAILKLEGALAAEISQLEIDTI